MYETPTITELGSVADFTRGAGAGNQQDGIYDFLEFIGIAPAATAGRAERNRSARRPRHREVPGPSAFYRQEARP